MAQKYVRDGVPLLADLMAAHPGLAIFRRFRSSNILNLLLLQAEVSQLEEKLESLVHYDLTVFAERRAALENLDTLTNLPEDDPLSDTLSKLRKKLTSYNQALLHQCQLDCRVDADDQSLQTLKMLMDHPKSLDHSLLGAGCLMLDKDSTTDLLMLSNNPRESGVISSLLRGLWPLLKFLPPSVIGRRPWKVSKHLRPSVQQEGSDADNEATFNQSKTTQEVAEELVAEAFGTQQGWSSTGDRISSFLAASLIVAPVIALHYIATPEARLGAIVGFTLAFSLLMVLITDAKRNDVFAATAAFAAVQVIYVGSALNSTTTTGAS